MIEIEKYNCNDSNEAKARERYWIESLNANLNMTTPNRTYKEMQEIWKQTKINNKDKIKEQQKEYKEINKDKIKEQMKAYRQLNKEKNYEKKKEYVKANPEKVKEWRKNYRERNREKINEQQNLKLKLKKDLSNNNNV